MESALFIIGQRNVRVDYSAPLLQCTGSSTEVLDVQLLTYRRKQHFAAGGKLTTQPSGSVSAISILDKSHQPALPNHLK